MLRYIPMAGEIGTTEKRELAVVMVNMNQAIWNSMYSIPTP